MKTICNTLEVARSNIENRIKTKPKKRGNYQKSDDTRVLPMIRSLMDERPTYGYRRIHALLNRQLEEKKINHKRVYRIMKQNHLLLTRHKGQKPTGTHEGRIITLKSNTRWCSDIF